MAVYQVEPGSCTEKEYILCDISVVVRLGQVYFLQLFRIHSNISNYCGQLAGVHYNSPAGQDNSGSLLHLDTPPGGRLLCWQSYCTYSGTVSCLVGKYHGKGLLAFRSFISNKKVQESRKGARQPKKFMSALEVHVSQRHSSQLKSSLCKMELLGRRFIPPIRFGSALLWIRLPCCDPATNDFKKQA